MKKVAVVLSGCGVYDGAEIHEATLTLLALDMKGAKAIVAAPDIPQAKVVDHSISKDIEGETRNVLVESARIARGDIRTIKELQPSDLDAVILPGGFGAALNLSNFATAGADMGVEKTLAEFLDEMRSQGKALGALCIAPPILGKVFKEAGITGVKLTIGNDPSTAAAITAMGHEHVDCTADSCVIDKANKVVTSPAYMLAGGIAELWKGVQAAVDALLDLA